jgi:uncharacterized protein
MASLSAPGVRFERLDVSAPPVVPLRTDVPGFVGLAERGPLDVPVPIESWRQFEARFGGFIGGGFLAYSVRGFFENGGRRCWVVRVASREPLVGAEAASLTVAVAGGNGGAEGWRIRASSAGAWGNAVAVVLRETHAAQTLSDPSRSTTEAAAVLAVDGFARFTAVRVSQEGSTPVFAVVSDVDPVSDRLVWMNADPAARTRYEAPLVGLDVSRTMLIESIEYTLLVFEAGRFVRGYTGLSAVPEHSRYGPRLLGAERPDAFASFRPTSAQPRAFGLPRPRGPTTDGVARPADLGGAVPPPPEPVVIEELRPQPLTAFTPLAPTGEAPRLLSGGADGLAHLRPDDFSGNPTSLGSAPDGRSARGFRALDEVDEVTTVAVPDLHVRPVRVAPQAPLPPCVPDPCLPETASPPTAETRTTTREDPPIFTLEQVARVQAELVDHCEARADRVALLDPPAAAALDPQDGPAVLSAWRQRFSSSYAIVYWPWLRVADPLRRGEVRDLPPSGHAAGLFARIDLEIGVHRAPANFALEWAQDVTFPANEVVHGELNSRGVNVLRALPGREIRILGARTLFAAGPLRFVPVRRLLIMVRKAIDRSIQWSVFEPNDHQTRAKLRLTVSSFLLSLWQRGALAGATADEAFRVQCDEENNPPTERDNGRLVVDIALAPTHPLEFIILRVGRTENEFEIVESSSPRGV